MAERSGPSLTRRRLLRGVGAWTVGAAGVSLLAACQPSGSGPAPGATAVGSPAGATPRRGGSLAIALLQDPGALVPFATTQTASFQVQTMVYDALVNYDPADQKIKGRLAESWQIAPDGKSITFKLRQGVRFHDGNVLTADDVALNYERVRDPNSKYFDRTAAPAANGLIGSADKVAVVDPTTVRYVLKSPNLDFLTLSSVSTMMSPAVIKQLPPDKTAEKPVGTSAFRFVERQEGRIVLQRFDDHWNGAPYLDRLVLRVYPDEAGATAALEAGDVDFVTNVSIPTATRLGGDRFKILRHGSQFTYMFVFNQRHPSMKDVRVRQALNYAVNKEKIAKDLFKDQAVVARGMASPTFPSWSTAVPSYPYDPERAKKLLADAGFANGLTLRALQQTGTTLPLLAELAQTVQADLKNVGVTLTYDLMENTAWTREITPGLKETHAIYITAFGGYTPTNLEQQFGKRYQPPNGVNRGWFENPELERLFDAARGELDAAKRNELYTQADRIIRDEAAALFVVIYGNQALHTPKLSGVQVPAFVMDFSKAWLSA